MQDVTTLDAVKRVRAALLAAGHPDSIRTFPAGTRTAADAAAAAGCEVAQIAKSIVFAVQGGGAAVVIASGANRVDRRLAGAALGVKLVVAAPDFVLAQTGFAAGGVSPLGLPSGVLIALDEDLLALDPVWAAAGSASHVFRTQAETLRRMTGAVVVRVRAA
ncbi:MAG: YbaK/EbsC family protein [Janthinobacterium lividum]